MTGVTEDKHSGDRPNAASRMPATARPNSHRFKNAALTESLNTEANGTTQAYVQLKQLRPSRWRRETGVKGVTRISRKNAGS